MQLIGRLWCTVARGMQHKGMMRGMDPLELGAQPQCPDCGIVMRPDGDGDACPSCGHREPWEAVSRPSDPPGIIDL